MNSNGMTEFSAARAGLNRFRRMITRLLPLLILVYQALPAPAHATDIYSGQSVSGTIANGTQVDVYNINPTIDVNNGIEASIGTDGTAGVELKVIVKNSAGTQKCAAITGLGATDSFFALCQIPSSGVTTGGTWTVSVQRFSGTA